MVWKSLAQLEQKLALGNALSSAEIKQLYEDSVKKFTPSPPPQAELSHFFKTPTILDSEEDFTFQLPSSADKHQVLQYLHRAYRGLQEKDLLVLRKAMETLRKVVAKYDFSSLTEDFLIFFADQNMWDWLGSLEKRSINKHDWTYCQYLQQDLSQFLTEPEVFKS